MDEREANIDLLFRNGLKDYEVLPPPEAWDKISPAVRKQQRAYIVLRVAAMIAVLVTLGFLVSTWNNEVTDGIMNTAGTPDLVNQSPQSEISDAVLLADAGLLHTSSTDKLTGKDAVQTALKQEDLTEQSTAGLLKLRGLPEAGSQAGESALVPLSAPVSKSIDIYDYPITYFPEPAVNARKDRWTIAALVSPTYLSTIQSGTNEAARQLGSVEQPVISYAGGVALSYKVSRRLSVQSGLYYSSYGNELSGITAYGGFNSYDQVKGNSNFEVQTTTGTVYTDNSDVYLIDNVSDARLVTYFDNSSFDPAKASLEYLNNSLRQNLSYLELPLILRYKLIDRTFDFNIIGGLSSNLLVNNSVYTSLDGSRYEVGKTGGLNTLSFSSSLGMGMEYSFSSNLSLNLEPTFRYFLNPFNNMEGVSGHPYSFGIFSGISYKF